MEGTKTLTETQTSVTRKGDLVTVKTVETTTVTAPGKPPKVTTKEKIEKYEGKDGLEKLPEEIKKQLEDSKDIKGPINKTAAKDDFEKVLLEETNKKREAHGAPPLKLNDKASKYALERATAMAEKDEMLPRESKVYGENVSGMWSNDPNHTVTTTEILDRWYEEHSNFQFGEEPTALTAGHFTQLVWKNSKHFGAAAVKSKSNKIFVVAAYEPPGNWVGEFKENVLPQQKSGITATLKSLLLKNKGNSSSSDSDSDSDESSLEDFNKKGVKVHNNLRKKHNVPSLSYSSTLSKYAQDWAEHLASSRKFEHRPSNRYGENIYTFQSSSGKKPTAKAAIESWYSEIKDHTFGCEPKSTRTGHFTQVVWKDSKEVGMGIAKGGNGWIVVANYNPPGNFVGSYTTNVPQKK